MSTNVVHLGELGFSVNNDDDIEGRFMSAETAPSLLGVYSLEIWCDDNTDTLAIISPLTYLCNSLDCLTYSDFPSFSDNVVLLFVEVLQNVTTLRDIKFGSMVIKEEATYYNFYDKPVDIRAVGNQKSLCLNKFQVLADDNHTIEMLHLLLDFILESCPNLMNSKLIADERKSSLATYSFGYIKLSIIYLST